MDPLHAHLWGTPWTDDLGIFPLSKEEQKLLLKACEELSVKEIEGTPLWRQVNEYLGENPYFFKLSPASPKDVTLPDRPSSKVQNAEELFTSLTRSFRILEYLEEESEDYAIVVRPWNDKIVLEHEYRCFIFEGMCEAVSRIIDCSEPTPAIKEQIKQYIKTHKETFPDTSVALDVCCPPNAEIIFIEFNPINDALDRYGIIERGVPLSERAYAMMLRPSRL